MSEVEVIGTNGWGKIVFEFSVETNDDGNGATFSNDDGMFIHTDFEPKLSFDGHEIPLARLAELAAAEREGCKLNGLPHHPALRSAQCSCCSRESGRTDNYEPKDTKGASMKIESCPKCGEFPTVQTYWATNTKFLCEITCFGKQGESIHHYENAHSKLFAALRWNRYCRRERRRMKKEAGK